MSDHSPPEINKLRWGIIGAGAIARKFALALRQSQTGDLAAVGSRTENKLGAFLADFPARGHVSYEALLADPEVDVVYISVPHPFHAEWAIRAAKAGKHILCEKPLAINAAQAVEVIDAARTANVFLMEAFAYRCHPRTARLLDLIREGRIGAVRMVHASFSFRSAWNPDGRLLNRALGGGGVLDVGCYCTSISRLIAGVVQGEPFAEPVALTATAQIGDTGVDELALATLQFPNGMLAMLSTGVRVQIDNSLRVYGEEGYLEIPNPWAANREACDSILYVRRLEEPAEEQNIHVDRAIYALEADTVAKYLRNRESPTTSWADSMGNMRLLDRWRAAIGVTYDSKGEPNRQ